MKLLFFWVIVISLAFVVVRFVQLDGSFVDKDVVFIDEQKKNELITKRGFNEIKNDTFHYVEMEVSDSVFIRYNVFQEKRSIINPLGTLINYLQFDYFFYCALAFSIIFIFAQYLNFQDITYLYYTGYVFSNILYFFRQWAFGFLEGSVVLHLEIGVYLGETFMSCAYMILYAIFIRSLLGDEVKPRFFKVTKAIILLSIIFGLIDLLFGIIYELNVGNLGEFYKANVGNLEVLYKASLIPFISVAFIQIFNSKVKRLRVFIIVGSLFLVFLSLTTGLMGFYDRVLYKMNGIGLPDLRTIGQMFYFKIGVILEILCFAMGLGYRTKMIDEERNKLLEEKVDLSDDLHEDVGGDLVALKTSGDILLVLKEKNRWDEIEWWVNRMNEKIIEIIGKLNTFVVSTENKENKKLQDLFDFIKKHCDYIFSPEKVEVSYDLNKIKDRKDIQLSSSFFYDVAMIAKEIITNIKKHSQCDRVVIMAEVIGPSLRISISDNGIGLSSVPAESGKPGGNGLLNIQNRAAKLDGKLEIKTGNNQKGTTFELFIQKLE